MPSIAGLQSQRAARVSVCGLLAFGALATAGCSGGSGPEQVDPKAWAWNAPISASGTVYVRNTNGSVEVKPATGGNVEVTAEVRWHRGNPKRDIQFQAVTNGNTITICALWETSDCSASSYQAKGKSGVNIGFGRRGTDASVAFTVYVPTGVRVDAFTMSGSIGVAATAPVKAQTLNGTIRVATAVGPVDAETINGDVDARMTTLGPDGPVRVHSVNGSVSAYLPEKVDGTVRMETTLGGVTSDFALAGETKADAKHLTGTVGAGGREIDLATVTGTAALHKLKPDGTVAAP